MPAVIRRRDICDEGQVKPRSPRGDVDLALKLGVRAGRAWLMATHLGLEPCWGKLDARHLRGALETSLCEPDCGPRRKLWISHRTLPRARQRSTRPQGGDHGTRIVAGSELTDQPPGRQTGFWRRTGPLSPDTKKRTILDRPLHDQADDPRHARSDAELLAGLRIELRGP